MNKTISNDQLDYLIWHSLRDSDIHPTNCDDLLAAVGGATKWRRIDGRIQAMRKTGKIRFYRGINANRPAHVRAHGWEVLGCPGVGYYENSQWNWREGCEDCTRRTDPNPVDGAIEPPPIITLECHLRIALNA